MDICPTIKVKPWSKDQGEYVEINSADFDPEIHTAFDAPASDEAAAPEQPKPRAKRRRKGK